MRYLFYDAEFAKSFLNINYLTPIVNFTHLSLKNKPKVVFI